MAHGGASGPLPGNTLEAFQHAIDVGANFITCEVVVTHDQQVGVLPSVYASAGSSLQGCRVPIQQRKEARLHVFQLHVKVVLNILTHCMTLLSLMHQGTATPVPVVSLSECLGYSDRPSTILIFGVDTLQSDHTMS